jgi:hypothetical protein
MPVSLISPMGKKSHAIKKLMMSARWMGSLLNKNSTTGIQASITIYPKAFIQNLKGCGGQSASEKTMRYCSIFI